MNNKKKIFISYRRANTKGYAHAIYNILLDEYGEKNIFMDVDTISPGEDFVERLTTEVNYCDVFLALIGPDWVNIRDERGNRRLDNPKDYVRIEIESALKNKKVIIPILIENVTMPQASDLRGELSKITNRQAFIVGNHLRSDIKKLVGVINSINIGNIDISKKIERFPWASWLYLSIVTIPSVFFVLMVVVNFFWYFTSGYISRNYNFVGLQPVIESSMIFIYLMFSEGLVSIIQWAVILRKSISAKNYWIVANSLFGLITGFITDSIISNNQVQNDFSALVIVFWIWVILNVIIGPIVLHRINQE